MAHDEFPSTWRDPRFIAAIVGAAATGAIFAYLGTTAGSPSPETFGLALLAVLLPVIVAHELAAWYGR